jgi:small-conductance mechanosensitive channel
MSTRDELTKMLEPYAELFNVSSIEAMALRVLGAALILLLGFWIAKAVKLFLVRRMEGYDSGHAGAIHSYSRFVNIVVTITAVSLALHTLGIDLTHWFTAGGLLAVAFAFAMKNVSENLVSGLILRLEQVIKCGDVLYLQDGKRVWVKTIGMRATVVRAKNEGDLIIPNAELVQNLVSNYTYRDSLHRIDTQVGVAYSSDLKQVRMVLEQTCNNLDWKSGQKTPQVLLIEFGDSAVNYRAQVWVENPWDAVRLQSELNEAIWWALKDAGIVIAFPQRDVHVIQETPTSQPGRSD